MKKLSITLVLIGLLAFASVGVAQAQEATPPMGGRGYGQMQGAHLLDGYMHDAIAAELGISPDELQARHDAGETLYDIAAGLGITDLAALMDSARAAAVTAAVADGVITAEQAEWMNSHGPRGGQAGGHGQGNRGGQAGGRYGNGTGLNMMDCPYTE